MAILEMLDAQNPSEQISICNLENICKLESMLSDTLSKDNSNLLNRPPKLVRLRSKSESNLQAALEGFGSARRVSSVRVEKCPSTSSAVNSSSSASVYRQSSPKRVGTLERVKSNDTRITPSKTFLKKIARVSRSTSPTEKETQGCRQASEVAQETPRVPFTSFKLPEAVQNMACKDTEDAKDDSTDLESSESLELHDVRLTNDMPLVLLRINF